MEKAAICDVMWGQKKPVGRKELTEKMAINVKEKSKIKTQTYLKRKKKEQERK